MTTRTFAQQGDFEAHRAACEWLEGLGYSVGQMQGPEPIGLLKGDFLIAKWRNLSAAERKALDGTITGDKRNGPVTVTLKDEQPHSVCPVACDACGRTAAERVECTDERCMLLEDIRAMAKPAPVQEYREPWRDRPDFDMDTFGRPLRSGT